MSTATFVGGTNPALWSNSSDWAGKVVPASDSTTNVIIAPSSSVLPIEDLGTVNDPFVVHNITSGLGMPASLEVTGFLHAHTISDMTIYTADPDLGNPTSPAGSIDILGSAKNTAFNIEGANSTVEIGHSVTGSSFSFAMGAGFESNWSTNAKLILVRPPKNDLSNAINLPPVIPPLGYPGTEAFSLEIELGKVQFDKAAFIPSMPGSSTGDIQLSDQGKVVYNLSNVTMPDPTNSLGVPLAGTLSTGRDPTTGYDYVAYSHV